MGAGQHGAGAVGHLAVRQGRPVLDHEHPGAPDRLRAVGRDRRGRLDDRRARVERPHARPDRREAVHGRGVHLVDDDDVRAEEVDPTGEVRALVAGPVRIDHRDVNVGTEERQVVVAAVPEDHVALGLRGREDGRVVDAGEHREPLLDVRLVLLHLLDRAALPAHVLQRRESLHPLCDQVAVGHGVTHDDRPPGRGRGAPPRRAGWSGSCRSPSAPRTRPPRGVSTRAWPHPRPAAGSPLPGRRCGTPAPSRAGATRPSRRRPPRRTVRPRRAPRVAPLPRWGCRRGSAARPARRGSAGPRCRGSASP